MTLRPEKTLLHPQRRTGLSANIRQLRQLRKRVKFHHYSATADIPIPRPISDNFMRIRARTMTRCLLRKPRRQIWPVLLWLTIMLSSLIPDNIQAQSQPFQTTPAKAAATNTLQLRRLASRPQPAECTIRIEGIVLWASLTNDLLFLQDDSGGIAISMNLHGQPTLMTGQKVIVEGKCLAGHDQVTSLLSIDNDGIHAMRSRSKPLPFPEGLNRIHLEWFNLHKDAALRVEWAGPGIHRQTIPDNVLFYGESEMENSNKLAHGLTYQCYEGSWEKLPDFHRLIASKTGAVTNFNIGVRSRDEEVGIVFEGFINMPKEGNYTFWINSDDGSRLYVGANLLHLQLVGAPEPPVPLQLIPNETVSKAHDYQWAEVEGIVTYVSDYYFGNHLETLSLEIVSGQTHTHLQLLEECHASLRHLLGCKIKAMGICQIGTSIDQVQKFSLLVPSAQQIVTLEMAPGYWEDCPVTPIKSLAAAQSKPGLSSYVHLSGIVCSNLPQEECWVLKDGTGQIMIQSLQSPPGVGKHIEALGKIESFDNEPMLKQAFWKYTEGQNKGASNSLPLLTQAIHVKMLSPNEARQGYPVKLRGVITAHLGKGFVIQDSSWSTFCRLNDNLPPVGENWEIEGDTDMDFAPTVKVNHTKYLGAGILPQPIHPRWDELINGSLDTQYIEIQGVATTVNDNSLLVLTHEGKVWINCPDIEPKMLAEVKDALIRVRGVFSPSRDLQLQMNPMHLRLNNVTFDIDAPAPAYPFKTQMKKASDMLHFDANANALRRIRLGGQVIYQSPKECYLLDEQTGWRFQPRNPVNLKTGDLVEAVGFPAISGRSPLLQEAVIRNNGNAKLPVPIVLQEGNLLNARYDSTLVRIKAGLLNFGIEQSNILLQLQAGNQGFVARLENKNGTLQRIEPGSQLELTGVYAVQAMSNPNSGPNIESFVLLLNSPTDVRILAKPSWWTARHALLVVTSMLLLIAVAFVWIVLLRQQVEERSRRLAVEIKHREQIESQRIVQEERFRIAQDLHDDLGAALTQIGFLSAVKSFDFKVPGAVRDQLKQVSEKSRHMVASLDQIVWAVNPANDSLRSLTVYLRHITEEFFRSSAINCRLDIDKALPNVILTSEARHNLCLSVREALNNSAKHSHATELWLRIHGQDKTLEIIVEDNGCGFAEMQAGTRGNGLVNMKQRMKKIGGNFECRSQPGSGTTCRMTLPLNIAL